MFINEKIIETKSCQKCQVSFDVTDKDLEFYDRISAVFEWKKYSIPSPTLCPDCRQQRRLSFRNERNLYKGSCDATGWDIVSIYNKNTPHKVYDQKTWWWDDWDAMEYGKDYDFGTSFFEQYRELFRAVPHVCLMTGFKEDVNTHYANYAWSNKDCYMIFNADFNEDCLHIASGFQNMKCVDCFNTHESENCYECVDVRNCFSCLYSTKMIDCSDSILCENCVRSSFCFWSTNLTNKKYYIFNTPVTKQKYLDFIHERDFLNKENRERARKIQRGSIHKSMYWNNAERATGDYIFNSKNIAHSYEMYDSEDCKYCLWIHDANDCYDVTYFWIQSLNNSYESNVVWVGSNNVSFSSNVVSNGYNIFYSYFMYEGCSDCFWCVWLRHKQYCILNRQYTKQQYHTLVPKIIEHMQATKQWWEYFPSDMSAFGYNETLANEYFPLTQQSAKSKWFNWSDYEAPAPQVDKIIPANKLPENILDIPDDILTWAIQCEITQKPFKITSQELAFYRRHHLPIPKRHPDQRHLDRMSLRNPRKLYERDCNKCKKQIQTTYSPERLEIVYCTDCYDKEIY